MANRFLQSLLGEEDYQQARSGAVNNALLMAGLQGLLASGPSPTPVGLGQVIGQAGMAGLGAYGQSMEQAGLQGMQSMELDQMRQEQARMEAEAQREEAFNLATEKIFSGGRVDYNALQQLAVAFPERAGPLISALQSARPPAPAAPNRSFRDIFDESGNKITVLVDNNTGEIVRQLGAAEPSKIDWQIYPDRGIAVNKANPLQSIALPDFGRTPVELPEDAGPQEIADAYRAHANVLAATDPAAAQTYLNAANAFAPTDMELEQKSMPAIQLYTQQSNNTRPLIRAAETGLRSLEDSDDMAARGAVVSWLNSIGIRPRDVSGVFEESGIYSEVLRAINQAADGGPMRPEQRQQIAREIRKVQEVLRNEQRRYDNALRQSLESIGRSKSYIDNVIATGMGDLGPPTQEEIDDEVRRRGLDPN